jgi:hypothetical protein
VCQKRPSSVSKETYTCRHSREARRTIADEGLEEVPRRVCPVEIFEKSAIFLVRVAVKTSSEDY